MSLFGMNNKRYHIIHLPRTYPSKLNPLAGIFFKQQVDGLRAIPSLRVSVIAMVQKSVLRCLSFTNLSLWGKTETQDDRDGLTLISYLFSLPLPFLLKRYYVNLRCYITIIKYAKKYGKPDIIHLQTYEMGIAALWIKKRLNIPYIVTEHSSNLYADATRLSKRLLSKIYIKSSYNIAVSPYFANFLSTKFNTKFNFIPNGVAIEKNGIKKDKNNALIELIHVAHCVPIKQQDLLLRGFKQALDENQNIHLTVIGDGPELPKLEILSSELKITAQITFCGALSNAEVKRKMSEADIFILTSKKETFGVVLIEAMSLGLPCISTRSGGPEGIITNKFLGLLCEHNDKSIARAISIAASRDYNHQKIHQHAARTYSSSVVSSQIEKAYKEVVSDKGL